MNVTYANRTSSRKPIKRDPTLRHFDWSAYLASRPKDSPSLTRDGMLESIRMSPGTRHRPVIRKRSRRPGAKRGTVDPILLALIDRTSFGYSQESYDDAAALGYDAYLESQLDPASIDDSEMDGILAPFDTLTMTSQEIYTAYEETPTVPATQLVDATVLRGVFSKRQLLEVMVQFWSDHFSIDLLDELVPFFKTADDRDVIRQYALSTFPELLNASAHSAAMLFYLDNYTNAVGHAQENYARELMELHTIGVNGGYTQQDVEEVARCFTGWTIYNEPNYGEFVFWEPYHDTGSKVVLGQTIPAGGGESDGLTVLDMLAYHPNTAGFISRKLCTRFLGYDPPEDIVQAVKADYLATGGDIKSMLRIILQQDVIQYLRTPKLKRPFRFVTSLLRSTDADVISIGPARNELVDMGHGPFLWLTPDGYPDSLEEWASSLLPRWNFASDLFDGDFNGISVDAAALLAAGGDGAQGGTINQILTGGGFSALEVSTLQQFFDDLDGQGLPATTDSFGLGGSFPSFQWH